MTTAPSADSGSTGDAGTTGGSGAHDVGTIEDDGSSPVTAKTVRIDDMTFELRHDERLSQFGAWHRDARVSFASYVVQDGSRVFHHTETLPAWGGRGLAGEVVRFALDETVAAGLEIVPACSFVVDFVRENDEWDDHIAARG